ncbi:MAG TPA: transporter substrate-binding domain-containing protein [Rhizobiaceae bacterium]|nr:transporter substrate-binding domain-containing protein [Rhizobiaceae bacterium]
MKREKYIMDRRVVLAGVATIALIGLGGGHSRADELQQIKQKGTLTVGVKADYPPFGFRQANGDIVGIEPDMARDLAKRLGVKIALVPVVASNRIQFLQQGRIDVMIATMNYTAERAKQVQFVPPNYYASGYNVMVPKAMKATSWDALKGKTICAIQGSFYNRGASEKYGLQLSAFAGVAEALTALKQGRCVGFLYDDTAIEGQLLKSEWSSYDMPLPSQDAEPWGISVKKGEDKLAAKIHDAIVDWNKTGFILKLETKYGIKHHSPFVVKAHDEAKKG